MWQKICNYKFRFVILFANHNIRLRSVLADHNSMDCKRHRNPLILLHTAIIMGIQVSNLLLLIKRILLDINSRRINMSPQNIHTILNRLRSCLEEDDCPSHIIHINFITGFYRFFIFPEFLHVPVSGFLCKTNCLSDTFSLRLSRIQTFPVLLIHPLQLLQMLLIINLP